MVIYNPDIKKSANKIAGMCPNIKRTAAQIDPRGLGEIAGYEIGARVFNMSAADQSISRTITELHTERDRVAMRFERILGDRAQFCNIDRPDECIGMLKDVAMKSLPRISPPSSGREMSEMINDMLCVGGLDVILTNK